MSGLNSNNSTRETTLDTIDNVSAYFTTGTPPRSRGAHAGSARFSSSTSSKTTSSRRNYPRSYEYDDVRDGKVMVSILQKNLAHTEGSPRSLIDLEKQKSQNSVGISIDGGDELAQKAQTQAQVQAQVQALDTQNENYIADREDNENTSSNSRRRPEQDQRRKSPQSPLVQKVNSEGLNFDQPPQIERRRNDAVLKSLQAQQRGQGFNNLNLRRKYGSSPPKYIYHPAQGNGGTSAANEEFSTGHGNDNDNGFPDHPFPRSQQAWNPTRSGLFPSSFDTVLSGYGSLDYSSEDQSLDPYGHSRSRPHILSLNSNLHKDLATTLEQAEEGTRSNTNTSTGIKKNRTTAKKRGRQHRSKSLSSTDSPEQRLPLVPEITITSTTCTISEENVTSNMTTAMSTTTSTTTPTPTDQNQNQNQNQDQPDESQPLLGKPSSNLRPRAAHVGENSTRSPDRKLFPKRRDRQALIANLIDEARGHRQTTSCRDFAFTILFYAQIALIILTGVQYGPQAFGYIGTGKDDVSIERGVVLFTYRNVIILTVGCGIISILISSLMLLLMTNASRGIVQVALFMTMSLALMWSLIGMLFSPQTFIPVMGLVSFGVSVGYTFTVWDRIPFVTAQLNTALAAIKETSSIIALACAMQVIALIGIILYFFTCIGIYDYFQVDNHELSQKSKLLYYVGLTISFIWTFQVLLHVLKATTCGVVNHWWFSTPDEARNWNFLRESFLRAGVFSFGSVCLGSLFIGPANFLSNIAGYIRPNKDEAAVQAFVVLQELIVSVIDFVCSKFNNWAFCYVGMYGYNYFEAGRRAEYLFQRRGWKEIIEDGLLENVLFAFSIVIGGVVGCIAVLIEDMEKTRLYSLDYPSLVAFIIGAVVGLVLSNVLFCTITSSVDTVIICFAGSPDEFVKNHPSNSHEMRSAWREAWPGTVDFVTTTNNVSTATKSPSLLHSPGPNYLLGENRQKLDVIFV